MAPAPPLRPARPRRGAGFQPVVVALLAVTVFGLAFAMERLSYDIWAAFWIGPALLLLTVPIASRAARREGDVRLGRLLLLAAATKVIGGSLARYAMAFGVYDGVADADRYHFFGSQLAPQLRAGDYSELGKISGTRFIEVLTGQVYALTGPTRLGGFMVFSWLAFLGLYFLYRAFRIAVPEGDHRRYRLLVLFFPTLLFWPSSTGKEAWMILCLGLAALGIAQLFTGRLPGLVWAALGLWGAAIVRPHLALIVLTALVVAVPVRLVSRRLADAGAGRTHWYQSGLVLALFVVVAAGLVTTRAEQFFDLVDLNLESANETFTEVQRRTGQGGSEFDAPNAASPLGYLVAAATVLFRPLPFEAGNVQALVASGEGLLLLVLVVVSARRLVRLPVAARRAPYLLFAFAFVAAFVYAFSVIENFGILARQRAQLLPFLFALLCIAPSRRFEAAPAPDPDLVDDRV